MSSRDCARMPRALLLAAAIGAAAWAGAARAQDASAAAAYADAVRLLKQSTFAPNDALVAHVLQVGTQAFLNEQYAAPASKYPSLKYVPAGQQATFCPTDPDPQCGRDYYTLFLLQNAFFTNALSGPDQLRQRVAFALSQITVTSGLVVNLAYGMAKYQQIFLDNAFGNYEEILTRVTLSSVMGDYINMVNNNKPAKGVNPNENYARELMQLFSIGVWQLNQDGTQKLDVYGLPIPSYGGDEIEGFADVFTGWTYPVLPGIPARTHNPKNFLGDMVPVDSNHDKGTKLLLNGVTLPAGGTIQADLTAAIHNVFMHPNVGQFIGKQLIQKLVTGDPTPQYVSRVAAVFNNNGHGMRGDMKAVVNAILTDPDARGAAKLDAGYGKLREPVLFMAAAARALNTQSDGVFFGQQSGQLGQRLFYPASVFNYYPPTYLLPDTSELAPEFAIENSSTAINRYNFANTLSFGTIAPLATLPGAIGTTPNWAPLTALASDTSPTRRARRAVVARHDVRCHARVDHRCRQRRTAQQSADPRQDRVLSGRHIGGIPSGALTMNKTHPGRRTFLRNLGALSSFGLASRLDLLSLVAAANAQAATDYKALVCVFMFGGNDGNNTVIPIDTGGYGQYAAVRPAASGINLPQASLLPIEPVNIGAPYSLHPALPELQALFNKGKMAILANVGTLIQPITKAQYNLGIRPDSLYSHSDQQAQWQSSISDSASGTGWGGRIADKLAPLNAASGFPVTTSLDGTVLFTTGVATAPLAIPVTGSFALAGYSMSAASTARLAAVRQLLAQPSGNAFVTGANKIGTQALQLSTTVNPILANQNSTVVPLFANLKTSIANQLFQVAKMIEARAATGAERQIFFVQLGSFDTHGDQLNRQQNLFAELSPALKAFYDATVALGVSTHVTTFTLSDFGRTFQPASGGGTDHAWGSDHFIIGDAVQGGAFYGEYPQLVLGGPSDAESEGRWLPSTAVDQYGATLAKWFGVAPADLDTVFPNLDKFATSNLGFMG